jgi:repressor LexA
VNVRGLDGVDMARRLENDPIQQQALAEITNARMEGRPVPTTRELARKIHAVESAVHRALSSLEDQGHIERGRDSSEKVIPRDIRPTTMPQIRFIPLVGHIAAGKPILSSVDIEGYIPLPVTQVHGDAAYVLRVRGESMIGDHIRDGDYVVVIPDTRPNNGEIVVVRINNEATVKHIKWEEKQIRLESSNPDEEQFPPIFVEYRDNPQIQGKVIGVIRWLQ